MRSHSSSVHTNYYRIRTGIAANDATIFVGTVLALVADVYQRVGINERVANAANAVALFAPPSDGYARLFPTHDQIGMVFRHAYII